MDSTDRDVPETGEIRTERAPAKRPYEAPRLEKKRSVQRATLFSGGGVTSVGLTADG